MKRLVTPVMAAVLVLGACGPEGSVGQTDSTVPEEVSAPSSTSTSTSTPSSTTSSTTRAERGPGVTIAVSGWLGNDQRGNVVCPYEWTEVCPGIPVTGGELPVEGLVRVTGWYDGVSLSADTVESWTPYERAELVNPCTGGSGRATGGQSPEVESEVQHVLAGHEDRVAGLWYADGQLVVGLTGADDELAQRIREIDEKVCVEAGYAMSEGERQTLSNEIAQSLAFDDGAWVLDSWDTVVDNRIYIRVESIDAPTKDAVAASYGDVLELTAYIEVLDAPLADLPEQQPPVPADMVIPTAGTRAGFAMMAARTGLVLEVDPELGCLYAELDGVLREVVVWPYGYSAVSGDPTIIYDPAGNEVARTGVPFDLGGGSAGIETVDPSQRCNADGVWQMGGSTLYELETQLPQYFDSED